MRGSCVALLIAVVISATTAVTGAASRIQAANPTWSPDGTQIAFAYIGIPRGRVAVMSATDGSSRRSLFATDSCCEPVLWAAGNRIAFVANFELFSVSVAGARPKKLFTDTPWFILSPNRETVALDDGCGCGHSPDSVALVAVRGGKPLIVPRPKNKSDSIDGFSPDGTQLVFTRAPWNYNGNPKGKPVLMVQSVRGGAAVPLARSGLIGASHIPASAVQPQWSPDGNWIAVVVPGAKPKLELVSTGGGTPTVLVSAFPGASSFSWSPNSTRIAYAARGAPGRLMAVDLKGTKTVVSGSVNWVSNDSWDRPQWSPDATKLVFMAQGGGVWIVGADGTGLKRLA